MNPLRQVSILKIAGLPPENKGSKAQGKAEVKKASNRTETKEAASYSRAASKLIDRPEESRPGDKEWELGLTNG